MELIMKPVILVRNLRHIANSQGRALLASANSVTTSRHESTAKKGPFFPPARPTGPNPKKQEEMVQKLRAKTPIGKLDEPAEGAKHPHQEKDPLPAFPNNINPNTGEVGGPRGPEPTRFGDWERKGRVTDF